METFIQLHCTSSTNNAYNIWYNRNIHHTAISSVTHKSYEITENMHTYIMFLALGKLKIIENIDDDNEVQLN